MALNVNLVNIILIEEVVFVIVIKVDRITMETGKCHFTFKTRL